MLRLSTSQYVDIRQNEELGLKSLGTALSFYLKDLVAQEQKAREETERLAHEKAEREATEKATREKTKREAAEKAAKEKAERDAAEKTAMEKAAREKAEQEAAEKAAREKAERQAAEMAIHEQAEHEAIIREPHQKTTQKLQALWSKYARVGSVLNSSCYQRKLMEQARMKRATFNTNPLAVTA